MASKRWARVSTLAVTGMVVLSSVSAYGQLGLGKLKKNDEGKEQKREEKAEKERAKEAKQYDTLSEYAQHLYQEDPDFHDLVDLAYRQCLGEHAEVAYSLNMAPAYTTLVRSDSFTLRASEGSAASACGARAAINNLYGNPRIQDYVNRVGQQLVPANSDKLYAFKVTLSPVPYAYTLSTATIYISTGLISMTDNEAQLAYILSHEVAHVAKDHWKMKVMDNQAVEKYNQKEVRKKAIIGAAIGAAIGGIAGQSGTAVAGGAVAGTAAGALIGALTTLKRFGIDWNDAQENEADDFALQNTLNRNYDVQEVPKLYTALNSVVALDQRVSLGFMAHPARIKDRLAYARKQLLTPGLKTDYEKKLNAAQLVGTSPSYELMMADLKRDNGIVALAFDMFSMAKLNLNQAVSLRSDDARGHFYYGRVLKTVGRTDAEWQQAREEFVKAIKLDQQRHAIPAAELQQALLLMDAQDSKSQSEAARSLENYIVTYQQRKVERSKYGDTVPENIETLYDYLRLLGEPRWTAPDPPNDYYQLIARGEGVEGTRTAAYVKSDRGHLANSESKH